MKRIIVIALALVAVTAGASAAQTTSFYVGAGIGNTFFSSEIEDAANQVTDISENSTAWKIFGGFAGHKFLGIEGGYRDFGKIESAVDGENFETKTTGWDVEALGRFQIAIVDIFGKAGAMFWKTEAATAEQSDDTTGTDFFWGLGAGVRLGPIGVRLEWESVEIGTPDNLSMVSLSATLGF